MQHIPLNALGLYSAKRITKCNPLLVVQSRDRIRVSFQ